MKRILVVEDDKLLKKAIKEELEEAGFEVVLAETYREVIKQLEDDEIDLIFLDIMLPGEMDGFGILQTLKLPSSPFKKVPVVMLSNLGELEKLDRAKQLGAVDYVVKASIDLPKLVEITRKKLGMS